MVDVQAFFQRRIPEDAAARVGEEIPRPAPAPAHKASRAARARAAGGAAGGGVRRVRVGGVPAPFNAPWHFAASSGALRDAGLEVTWQDYQGGTASMTAALAAGKIDMAVRPPPAARRPRRRAG
jgi:ABC-type nitrate/sulfonate/bicarbonate transport system substrate-binding protein